MISNLRLSNFRGFRKSSLLLAIAFFVVLVPSMIGSPVKGSAGSAGRSDVLLPTTAAPSINPTAATLESGGAFEIKPSVIAGGGGVGTNGTARLNGTVGQSILDASTAGSFSVLDGFWQNGQAPAVTLTISGTISYCAAVSPPGAANTTVNLTGDAAASTSTGAPPSTGNYSFTNLSNGSYVVTPTKTGAISGINTTDVSRILNHIAGTPLTACQQLAADASLNGAINTTDVSHVLNHIAGNPPVASNHTGEWRFNPPSRTYISITSDQTAQNFDALLLGEVSGNWVPAGPTQTITSGSLKDKKGDVSIQAPCGAPAIPVTLPTASVASNLTNFTLPIVIGNTTGESVTGYDIRFTFDPAVVGLQATPVDTAGTLSSGMSFTTNTATPGLLIIVAGQTNPISGSGTLIKVNFTRLGAQGTFSNLTWTRTELNDANNDCIHPATANNGVITIGGPPSLARFSSFKATGYENGVHVNWQTGFEAENLGFNIYREVAGQRSLVNPDIIAGSALMAGTATKLQAGQSYGWWDNTGADQRNAQYWIEEIDLNGLRTMHGPFGVRGVGGKPPRESQAELLSQVGKGGRTVRQLPLTHEPDRGNGVHAQVSTMAVAPKLSALPALKLTIREEGWYRVSQSNMASAGFATAGNPRNLQLYLNGVEQPIRVVGEQGGRVDAIEFFATGQDKATTDAHVYWLVNGDAAGRRIGVVKSEAKSGGARSFPFTIERRDRTVYFSGLRNGEADNFFGQVVTSRPVDQMLTLRHLDPTSSDQVEVEVALQGVSDQGAGHSVRVLVNGLQVGKLAFSGQSHKAQKFTISRGLLIEGDNIVTLAAETGDSDVSLVDYIRVTYPHTYASDQDSLRMSVASGSQTIEGFSDATVRVFDITDPGSPVELNGNVVFQGGSHVVSIETVGQGARTLLALTEGRIKTPASISLNEPSNLRNKKNNADLLIITRREFFSALEPLMALRESQGLRVQTIDIDDIFDEFSNGERSPQAVRDFLSTATTTWKRRPSFVLFAGHASLDPRNHLGFGDSDLVPTKLIDTGFMETSSDDWFVDFNDDGLPELATGRLPFRTQNEAVTMVSKILSYERSRPATEALLVADANDGFDFEAANTLVRDMLPTSLKVNRIDRGRLDNAAAKTALIDAINRGQKIVNYMGHGSVNQWKGDLLTNDDATGLTNADRLSLFVMMTCMNGYFQDASLDSLAESLLKAERGGAAAVWASSGMTSPDAQAHINQQLYLSLFGGGSTKNQTFTLGEATMRAKAATGDADVRRTWVLLGDPTMRLK